MSGGKEGMMRYEVELLIYDTACTSACTSDFGKWRLYHGFRKADRRISVKDYSRKKNLKILLARAPFAPRQFFARMNGQPWPKDGRPVSLTRVFTALRKAVVRGTGQ